MTEIQKKKPQKLKKHKKPKKQYANNFFFYKMEKIEKKIFTFFIIAFEPTKM